MHAGACVFQVPAQMLSKSLDCSFGGVVCWIARWVGNTLLAARDDNARGLRLRGVLDHGEKRVYAVNNTKKIGFEGLVR